MSDATNLEKRMVIGLVGAMALYSVYLGEIESGKNYVMLLVTYVLARDGV